MGKKKRRLERKLLDRLGGIDIVLRRMNAQQRVDANVRLDIRSHLEQLVEQAKGTNEANEKFFEQNEPLITAAREKLIPAPGESEITHTGVPVERLLSEATRGFIAGTQAGFPKQLFEASNESPTIFDKIRSGEIKGGTVNGVPFSFGEPVDANENFTPGEVNTDTITPSSLAFGEQAIAPESSGRQSGYQAGYQAGYRTARNERIVIADESRNEMTDEQIKNHTGRLLMIGSPDGPMGSFERIFRASAPSEVDDGLNEQGWSPLYPTTPEKTPTAPVNTIETENK